MLVHPAKANHTIAPGKRLFLLQQAIAEAEFFFSLVRFVRRVTRISKANDYFLKE